jgi:cell division protein FtsA
MMPGLLDSDGMAVLDIGSAHMACAVLRQDETLQIAGLGYSASGGWRGGAVADMGRFEKAVARVVHQAEAEARQTVRHVWVSFSGSAGIAQRTQATISLPAGQPVSASAVSAVMEQTARIELGGMGVLHHIPLSFFVDGATGLSDPSGLYGSTLGCHACLLLAPAVSLKNIQVCVNRCHIDVQGFVSAPLMTVQAALTPEEQETGCVLVDFGASATTVCMVHGGQVVDVRTGGPGAQHITHDLAQALGVGSVHAERLKVMHGLLPDDEAGQASAEADEEDFSASLLRRVTEARVEEILDHVRHMIRQTGLDAWVGRKIVLTGGGSRLKGLREQVEHRLGRVARIADSTGFAQLDAHPAVSSLFVLAGMVRHVQSASTRAGRIHPDFAPSSLFHRISRWVRENI